MSLRSSPRVLVTGFGPFGGEAINPSGVIAERLGGLCLPVAAEEAWEQTRAVMRRSGASIVLALGVAGGRSRVCVEKRAVNEAAYPLADDAGRVLAGPLRERSAPAVRETAFSAADIARAIRRRSVPAWVSRDAGRYVCNHFYYLLLERLEGRAVFLHIPRLPETVAPLGGGPSLCLEDSMRAAAAALRFLERQATLPS